MNFAGDFYAKSEGEKAISDWGHKAGAAKREIKLAQDSMTAQLQARGYSDGAAFRLAAAWDGKTFTVTVS